MDSLSARPASSTTRRPVRVVHVITDLAVGGAEMMLTRLASQFDAREIETVVISLTRGGALAAPLLAQGIRVVAIDMRRGRLNLREFMRLRQLLRDLRPDVVQTWLYHADLVGLAAGRLAGVSSIAWNVRCSELTAGDYARSLRWIVRVLAAASRVPAVVVCNSEAGRRAHERLGYRPSRWQIIPNGIDTNVFQPSASSRADVRREMNLDPSSPLVGIVGRSHPMKDHDTFLRAAAIVVRRRPDVCFLLVGRGVPENEGLRRLSQELDLAQCTSWAGERLDTHRLFAAMDVAASSSSSGEGFPTTVVEAMACGTPCVVTDVGDSAEIVADSGLVVAPGNAEALADGILRTLSLDVRAREASGIRARERVVTNYSLATVAARYGELYRGLSDRNTRGVNTTICAA